MGNCRENRRCCWEWDAGCSLECWIDAAIPSARINYVFVFLGLRLKLPQRVKQAERRVCIYEDLCRYRWWM